MQSNCLIGDPAKCFGSALDKVGSGILKRRRGTDTDVSWKKYLDLDPLGKHMKTPILVRIQRLYSNMFFCRCNFFPAKIGG